MALRREGEPRTRGRLRVFWCAALVFLAGVLVGGGWSSWRASQVGPPVSGIRPTPVPSPADPVTPSLPSPVPTKGEAAPDPQEVPSPTEGVPPEDLPSPSPTPGKGAVPRVGEGKLVLVLDDMGYDLAVARRLASLGIPMTWAILPEAPHARETARIAREAGIPYLVHLPMQALGDPEEGPYAVGAGWTAERIRTRTLRAFEALPGAVGVNNHRGSRATSDRVAMERFLEVLRQARPDWIFLDSRTSGSSVAYSLARERGIRATRNRRFLDHLEGDEALRNALAGAAREALRSGSAVAIGHPRPGTVRLLEDVSRGRVTLPPGVNLETLPGLLQPAPEAAGGGRP